MWSRVGKVCSATVRVVKKAARLIGGVAGWCANAIKVLFYLSVLTEYVLLNVTQQYAGPMIWS